LSRDHSIRDAAIKIIHDKREKKEKDKEECFERVSSDDEEDDMTCRDYKPTIIRDYYFERKENIKQDEIKEAERAAAELVELDLRLASNIQVDKSEYKSPNLDNVLFATYIQNKHRIISDYSKGPTYIFLD
jgi:hypothetical protein